MTIRERLRKDLSDPDYRHAYADEHLNLRIASQIKVLREQQKLSQKDLAEKLGTKQAGISRLESANYSRWSVRVLKKLAEAFDLRLRISFEQFGTLWKEVDQFSREDLERRPFKDDPEFQAQSNPLTSGEATINLPPGSGKSAVAVLMVHQYQQISGKEIIPIDRSPLWNKKFPAQRALSAAGSIGSNSNDTRRAGGCI